jgi:hypothetical protein
VFSIQTLKKVIPVLAVAAGLTVSATACVAGAPAISEAKGAERMLAVSRDIDAEACRQVDAPMVDIPTASDTEPRMRIPQPPGWEPLTDLGDVEVTRFALESHDPADDEYPRRVVGVTLDRLPHADAQTIFDETRVELMYQFEQKGWPTDMATTATTVCGLPAERVTYAGDLALGASSATFVWVAIETPGHTYLATLFQTFEPGEPIQHDAETILSGFQVLPPKAST